LRNLVFEDCPDCKEVLAVEKVEQTGTVVDPNGPFQVGDKVIATLSIRCLKCGRGDPKPI